MGFGDNHHGLLKAASTRVNSPVELPNYVKHVGSCALLIPVAKSKSSSSLLASSVV
jgi:hypothetical protein